MVQTKKHNCKMRNMFLVIIFYGWKFEIKTWQISHILCGAFRNFLALVLEFFAVLLCSLSWRRWKMDSHKESYIWFEGQKLNFFFSKDLKIFFNIKIYFYFFLEYIIVKKNFYYSTELNKILSKWPKQR
jgi:hypothetical protein